MGHATRWPSGFACDFLINSAIYTALPCTQSERERERGRE